MMRHSVDSAQRLSRRPPLVTVVIPVRNYERYIGAAIDSVFAQTFTDWELVIVDDCSTDSTPAVIARYVDRGRVRAIRNDTNLGQFPTHNRGAELARGRYLKFLHGDDVLYPQCLGTMVAAMDAYPEAGLGISHDPSPWVAPLLLSPMQAWRAHVGGQTGMFAEGPSATIYRTDVFHASGGFDARFSSCDNEIMLRIAMQHPVLLLPPNLFWWRRHPEQVSERYLTSDACAVDSFIWIRELLADPRNPLTAEDRAAAERRRSRELFRMVLSRLRRGRIRPALTMWRRTGFPIGLLRRRQPEHGSLIADHWSRGLWSCGPVVRSPSFMTALSHRRAFIVSDVLGQKAGAYRLTAVLAQELARLGLRVTCFAQAEEWARDRRPESFAVVRPWLPRGSRWAWPERCLAWQARQRMQTERPDFVFMVGVTALARRLLQSEAARHLVILELTNATPDNKFVDAEASRLLGRARAVLSPSEAIDRAIRETYGYRGLLMRLPFWVEDLRQPYLPPPPAFLADFIFLGRLDEEKGLNELLHATAVVAKQFPGLRVLIAGQGSREPFAALARSLGVSPNVDFQFFDYLHQTDKMKALGSSRCLVLPSYHEGYPLVLLEAAQMSVPIIATQVGSIPDVFGRSDAALLIPPRNADALATAMLTIMTEPSESYVARRQAAWTAFGELSSAASVTQRLRELLEVLGPASPVASQVPACLRAGDESSGAYGEAR